eukprot:349646-Chlamydomonas_euryale.AAC.3
MKIIEPSKRTWTSLVHQALGGCDHAGHLSNACVGSRGQVYAMVASSWLRGPVPSKLAQDFKTSFDIPLTPSSSLTPSRAQWRDLCDNAQPAA